MCLYYFYGASLVETSQPAKMNGTGKMMLILLIEKFIGSADFSPSGENRKKREHMEAITREQTRKFLKSVHDDNVYCKYYEVV